MSASWQRSVIFWLISSEARSLVGALRAPRDYSVGCMAYVMDRTGSER